MKDYFYKNTDIVKGTELKMRDTIYCKDGCRMLVRVNVKLKTIQSSNSYKNADTGLFIFSITKIKIDNKGLPKLFSKVEKEVGINPKEIEFLDNNTVIIKKEIFDDETNMNYCFDIELEQFSRRSSKNMSDNFNDERRIEEETETVTAFLKVKGNVNGEPFSNDAEGSLSINYNKQEASYRENMNLFD
ncbi:MAG: hypothetical protein ACM3UU_02450 [Ignavibacteriales bacterium]